MAQMDELRPEALVMDHWLPDLEAGEFAGQVAMMYPGVDVLRVDGDAVAGSIRSPRRHELLHALREALDGQQTGATDGAAWATAPVSVPQSGQGAWLDPRIPKTTPDSSVVQPGLFSVPACLEMVAPVASFPSPKGPEIAQPAASAPALPVAIAEMIGSSAPMMELARLIRLVAPRSATVLIEGETGTGKEVVAKALHRLSARAAKPFAVLNCAAIPEALLEAELFGHTRGAFTGAVTSRTGRIEAAHGGTLFLDEIGEMPMALQAKMLRFLESGELQKVGENEVVRVDVRVIAATHQELEKRIAEGTFRLDLYHRLAVFPVEVPPLRERVGDIGALAEHFLSAMGKDAPRKRLSLDALAVLKDYSWPGNVRELAHVLERATILVGDAAEIGPDEIRFRGRNRQRCLEPKFA
jgi:transcriptional regulator with AAA-type ATPase domain